MILNSKGQRMCEFCFTIQGSRTGKLSPRACLERAEGITTDSKYPKIKFDACSKHRREGWVSFS